MNANIGISLAITELELANNQPKCLIISDLGSGFYASMVTSKGDIEALRQKTIDKINETFDKFISSVKDSKSPHKIVTLENNK